MFVFVFLLTLIGYFVKKKKKKQKEQCLQKKFAQNTYTLHHFLPLARYLMKNPKGITKKYLG